MTYTTLIVERKDPFATITLNRPEKLNAVSMELLSEMGMAMDEINEMADVRAVIIKGAGRAFSSGTDLQGLGGGMDRSRAGYRYHLGRHQDAFLRIERLEKPVIAQIHGYALGAAMELALACDFRIAAVDARFALPEVLYGIVPDLGGTQRLVRAVGLPKAKELVMMGDTIDGREAERIGLVNKAVEAEALESEVMQFAERFLRIPPLAVGLAKRTVDKSMDTDMVSSLDANATVQSMLLNTEDFREAITAKLEKREPTFKGK
ncbi:MAG: enoyl-CoA hydratase/isomerase family protein [Deltaproteobacteria bacterium]|nr:enoyl-CoA hydratase/isomerase family protein [Deltaproteobacteria bacterium]MBW1819484.1 enoyl-CoA hydratase/isomerase family protein [Deltaproteobacteria bacterium]MBW2285422.1 enoyl-CoA hydratase/isomerase family protein [Deltaproteobacteria bacterium]